VYILILKHDCVHVHTYTRTQGMSVPSKKKAVLEAATTGNMHKLLLLLDVKAGVDSTDQNVSVRFAYAGNVKRESEYQKITQNTQTRLCRSTYTLARVCAIHE